MNTNADRKKENKSKFEANDVSQMQTSSEPSFELIDTRPEAVAQMKLQEMANNSAQISQLQSFQEMVNNGHQAKQAAQLHAMTATHPAQQHQPVQKKENNTGLPDTLKSGMENLSGLSMDDVKVHRNSDKPAQLNAHAYAQGTDIHLGPGQEKHLPHELGHVVQQKEGRVKSTTQLKEKTQINDDPALEKEADVFGAKAQKFKSEKSIQKKSALTSDKTVQREVTEDISTTADNVNESMAVGSGAAALSEGTQTTNATNSAGIFADFMAGANSFKTACIEGAAAWTVDPKDYAKGANSLAEGSKGILNVIKGTVAASGATKGIKDSVGTIIPGISAAIGIFQNVMSMMDNQATWVLVDGLDKGILNDKEKEKVASFINRLDAKLGLDIIDFIFNIAEFIATFTGTGPAVALVHGCFNLVKGACSLTHGYFVKKGIQADQRTSGGDGDIDREQMAALDLHLKGSDKDEGKASKSIFGMVKSYGAFKALEDTIRVSSQQDPKDEKQLKKDRELLKLRKRILEIDLNIYNEKFKPKQASDPNAFFYGKVDVPNLTLEQIPILYKIHMNVVRTIIKQAQEGEHGYSKLKAWAGHVKKDTILKSLDTKLGIKIEDDLADWKLLSAMDPEEAGYFTEKTKTAIHISSKRKYFSDDEIQNNLQKILIDQKAKFLPSLIQSDSSFTENMENDDYEKAIKNKVKY